MQKPERIESGHFLLDRQSCHQLSGLVLCTIAKVSKTNLTGKVASYKHVHLKY